jgi:hypothetical protein
LSELRYKPLKTRRFQRKKVLPGGRFFAIVAAMSKTKAKKAESGSKSARRSNGKKNLKLARAAKKSAKANARRKAAAPAPRRGRAEVADKVIRTVSPPVQPVASPVQQEIIIRSHKYRVGETVFFTSPSFGRAAATGSYTVVKLLPSEGDDYQYRIKNTDEAFERVAKESQLDRA